MSFKHQAQIMRVARFNSGKSQAEMAVYLGDAHVQQISNIERAECGIPEKYWKRLAELTGVNNLMKALRNDLVDKFREVTK